MDVGTKPNYFRFCSTFFNRPLMIVEHLTCEYIVDRTANIVHKKVPGITGDMVVLFLGPVIESSSKINSVSPELL